jgi:large subunit ribosomal protein L18
MNTKREKKIRRHKRIRAKVSGTAKVPRLSVFRSGRHIYAQLINDEKGETIMQSSDLKSMDSKKKSKVKKTDSAKNVGKAFGEEILKKGLKSLVFDRGGYKYHGRIKALADGLREAGIKF